MHLQAELAACGLGDTVGKHLLETHRIDSVTNIFYNGSVVMEMYNDIKQGTVIKLFGPKVNFMFFFAFLCLGRLCRQHLWVCAITNAVGRVWGGGTAGAKAGRPPD